jgi:hypothetical protein
MISHQSMIHLTTIRRGSLATRLPNVFARKNAALIAEIKKKDKPETSDKGRELLLQSIKSRVLG